MTIQKELVQYASDCISGNIPSCTKHKWACSRFLRDLDRMGTADFPYLWDEDAAKKIVHWFLYLRHSKGVLAGEPIRLTTWQKFFLCQIYGWKNRNTGYRRFRKSFTEVGRKNAKSQMLGGVSLYESSVVAMSNGEINEIYTAGTKRDQSKIVFNECNLMTKNTPLRTKYRFKRDSIVHERSGSFIIALSKQDGKSGDGTNPSVLILDEYHQHQTTDFYDLFMGASHKESLLMIITTAGMDLTYPCYTQEYSYCEKILDPNVDVENDEYFVDILEADEGDDPGDIVTWKKANPIRAYYPEGINDIASAYEVAKQVPEKMISFMTKILDTWVQAKKNGYMNMSKWKACEVKEVPLELDGQPVYVGFDMSSKIDLTSVAFIIPYQTGKRDEQGKRIVNYYLMVHSFIPSMEKLKEHILMDKVPYDAWERLGYLTITHTPIVDQSAVMKFVMDTVEGYGLRIQCLCFDPANASKLMMDLSNEGYEVEEVYQSHKSLNESTQGFREQVYCGNVCYLHNPLLNYSMSNAVVRTNNGLIKIDKDATNKRIDPVDATLAAFKLALYHDFESENYGEYVDRFLGDYLEEM